MALASECMQPDRQASASSGPTSHQDMNNLVFLSQHWAVSHVECIRRLILLCKKLIELPDMFDEKVAGTSFRRRLSFSLRIMKLLGSLVKDMPYVKYDALILHAIASFADVLPSLFQPCFEFANNHCAAEGSFESIILLLLEEFLHIVQVIFCSGNFFQNIRACIMASILDNLDPSIWRYDNSSANLKVPLAYFPRTVLYILKLLQDLKRQAYQALDIKEFDREHSSDGADALIDSPSCHVHDEKVPLLKKFTVEELVKIIFPSSTKWVDNLMHLLFFLHSEGIKLRLKVERSHTSSRSNCTSELENTVCHEDEALFGNLFSEGSRSIGSSDGYDQPAIAVTCSSSNCNMPMQAAVELLSFLKLCLFSHDWIPNVFEDGCKKLSRNHIDILLSLLNCQGCCTEDKTSVSFTAPHGERKNGEIHQLCYELLNNLLTCHAFSDSLEAHLVECILNVESGVFVYNDQTLMLLARTLFCRVGLAGCNLRTKIYQRFVDFIVVKAKAVSSKCPSLKELLETLPSALHMEILLIAFYLSSEEEKAILANLIFSSLRAVDVSPEGFYSTQLSCWALPVSRLIFLLRHMIFYPHNCPPSLLLDLRSKLREAPTCVSHMPSNAHDHLSSWASIAVKSVMGTSVEEEPVISNLINQLIDTAILPPLLSTDEPAIQSLCLNWGDMRETFSWILGLWKGRKAAAVEDLIVERYIFSLSWDIPTMGFTLDRQPSLLWESQTLDASNLGYFFLLSHLVPDQLNIAAKGQAFPGVVVSVLQHLLAAHTPESIDELGWDFLRNGSWLSLVLSLLNVGIRRYCMKNKVPGVGSLQTESTSWDTDYIIVADGLICSLIETGQVVVLFRWLSTLLSRYLQAYQKAFLATFDNSQCDANQFASLLLLKHSGLEKCLEDELLEKIGICSSQLVSVFHLLLKVDEVVDKRALGILSKVFWECMLHGLPSHIRTPSGIFLSCVLSIRAIISALDGLLRMETLQVNVSLETEVLHQILDSVMVIKFDKIFESLHEKCAAIYCNLSAGLELADYSELFLMKNMEGYLTDISSREVSDSSILEWVVAKTIDTMDVLRKDPQKSLIFKFYLGAEDVAQQVKELYSLQRGDVLVLIDSLDSCYSELVNQKVLNFFVDLLSGDLCVFLKQKIQKKFLGMDLLPLSKWLEKRLLGSKMEMSGGVSSAKGTSVSLRESTMSFLLSLVSSPEDSQSRELHNHLFEAVLISLETAFTQFDIHIAKSYFHFVVQISRGENSVKQLLKRIVMLIDKLAGDERLLPGLKFLFGFLANVLGDCGSFKSIPERSYGKSLSGNNLIASSVASRPVGSRKNSDTLVLCASQEGGSLPLECDATSVDEDEDDGTSDGDIASIDKDEEDDPNSERALASKVCTFTSSGSNFMEQHWYFCYTCDLTVSKGCCSVCAKVCHRGHRVVYSRSSRFFCDCGAGGVRGSSCQCLKPRKYTGSDSASSRAASNFQSFLPFTEDADQLPESDSDLDEDASTDTDISSLRLSIPRELQDGIAKLLEELDLEGQVLKLCSSLLPSITIRREANVSKDRQIILGNDKVLSYGVDLLQLKKAYKSGSLDLKIKADYSNARELKSHLASGSLVKSLLSVSSRGRLAVGEGDKVAIFDVGQLIGQATIQPVTADKTNVKPLSRNIVRFEIVHLAFNSIVENYLTVAGYEDCQVLTLNPRGEVTDRLAIELALQGAYIRRVDWVPGSPVQLMVVTNKFVKIYDLSQDNISPLHYFTLPDDMIVDATLVIASRGKMFLIVLSECGSLYRLELSVEGNVGATPLKEIIQFNDREIHAKGLSLYFSSTYKLLFLSFQDGTTLVGRLSPNAASLSEVSYVFEEQDGKLRSGGLHRWKELLASSGLFFCFSSLKSNAAVAVSLGTNELIAQNMRHAAGSTSPLVGVTAYKPLSKDKVHCLVLHDDGSLQIYSHVPHGVDAATSVTAEKVKKLGSNILNNKAYAGTKPEFPLDFFEKTVCITADVKLGGDAIRNGDSEGAKQSLASEDGYVESPSPAGFKVFVF